jgi:diguanylate cyclase (GGDEF)-like protein
MGILIVDDMADMRESQQVLLESLGYEHVYTAGSAQEAFRILGMEAGSDAPPAPVDVILMDLAMPGVDGVEACRRIKSSEPLRDIPIIMVTGRTEEHAIERAFAAGALDYILKPARPVELLSRLRSAQALKRELDCRKARERELVEVMRQLEEANDRLHRLATSDALTGVANRLQFDLVFEREWKRAHREVEPLALLLIDIDHFKAFNDRFGHLEGDRCLKRVAATLQNEVKRPTDLAARYGGEEFVVLLPNTDNAGAIAVAESIRAAVERQGRDDAVTNGQTAVTVSVGLATCLPETGVGPEQLVAAADQALYAAKAAGRNRVCSYVSLPPPAKTVLPFDNPFRQDPAETGVEHRHSLYQVIGQRLYEALSSRMGRPVMPTPRPGSRAFS